MKLRSLFAICLLMLSAASLSTSCAKSGNEFAQLYKDLPFDMPVVARPAIPALSVDLTDFGASGNGIDLNTQAFANAIEYLSERGGGHLVVPAGIWRTGPIELKSNIDLHVTRDAIILFDSRIELQHLVKSDILGVSNNKFESPIHAEYAKNVSITGGGVIDGNGQDWRPLKREKVTDNEWAKFVASGGSVNPQGNMWYPEANMTFGPRVPGQASTPSLSSGRPTLIDIRECENVLLEDCLFQNSPFWNLHPLLCKNVIIKNVTVRNPDYAQNGDGLDVESCENVIIVNSTFDCGDDGICIKSGMDEVGRRRGRPSKNILVDGCTVYHGHGGFVVGSEMSGGVENIKVTNCRFLVTDVGLRFKSRRGRGGVVRGIYAENLYMTDIVTECILFDLYYGGQSAVELLESGRETTAVDIRPVDETTPQFRDIYIKDIVCNGARRAMHFNGLPEMPVENINISDCVITSQIGIQLNNSKDITMKNVKVTAATGEPVVTNRVENLVIE